MLALKAVRLVLFVIELPVVATDLSYFQLLGSSSTIDPVLKFGLVYIQVGLSCQDERMQKIEQSVLRIEQIVGRISITADEGWKIIDTHKVSSIV